MAGRRPRVVRLREVSVHSVDVDVGPDAGFAPERMWSDVYVHAEFVRQVGALARRAPAGVPVTVDVGAGEPTVLYRPDADRPGTPVDVTGTAAEVVAWILGRSAGHASWPALDAWDGVP